MRGSPSCIALGGGGAAIPVPRFQRRRINVRRGSRTEERGGIHPFFPPTTANGKTRDEMIVTFRKLGKNYRSPIIFCSIRVYQSIFQHDLLTLSTTIAANLRRRRGVYTLSILWQMVDFRNLDG